MFTLPEKKARIRLILVADIPLNDQTGMTYEEQLELIMQSFAANPHQINGYEISQKLAGRLVKERKRKK
jgi:hypothetical protein